MAATTAYQAGIETTDTLLSYGVESVWGTAPAVQFQAIRYISETLAGSKTRARPGEINATAEVSAAVTTQETASGAINYALSYGTFDDFMSVVMGNDWQAATSIAGAAADITLTNLSSTTATLFSATSSKFASLLLNQYVRTLGFTNTANNDIWRVTARASSTSMTLTKLTTGAPVTETPTGTNAQLRLSNLTNGTQFKSLYLQQKLTATKFLIYPGAYVTGMSFAGSVGQFTTGTINMLAQLENSATTDTSTGAVLAAPTGKVHDTVAGVQGVFWNNAAISAVVTDFSIQLTRQGAAAQYGVGSASAQGVTRGTLECTGNLKMYFKDFTYYALFKAETAGSLAIVTKDNTGAAYVITVLNATLMNPNPDASGPNQAVMATFNIEGNPATGGGTITIDRLAAT